MSPALQHAGWPAAGTAPRPPGPDFSAWRASVAPMLDWTDRHCRVFHRLLQPRARLYTEMVTTGALLHGDVPRHLDFDAAEHPVALQLGGSEPADLAACARLAVRWGYDEINLNCGCPSERVQRGAFGACLMQTPREVADGVAAMRDAAPALPVTVKHRIGLGRNEDYGFVRDFVGTVAEHGGCTLFIVHARNAWLEGLSPKDNREIPPLRPTVVRRLKADFPHLGFVLNGGLKTLADLQQALAVDEGGVALDGVMVGRQAYHEPWSLRSWSALWPELEPEPEPEREGARSGQRAAPEPADRSAAEAAYVDYMGVQHALGVPWPRMARHMLGLWNGTPGARRWRQVWSDSRLRDEAPAEVARRARALREAAVAESAGA